MEHGSTFTHGQRGTTVWQLLADAQPTNFIDSFELSAPRATLIAACIAAFFSLVGAIMTRNTANRQKQGEKNSKEVEYCRNQLGELYGPLSILRLKSRSLYDKLREEMNVAPKGQQDWRLVDHIVDVKNGSDAAKSTVDTILKINNEIELLITKHSALLETSKRHDSFDQFIAHNALLQQAWQEGANQRPSARQTFPYKIDEDIESDTESIKNRLKGLLTA